MPALISLPEAKRQLRIADTDDAFDVEVQERLVEASDIVVDYVGARAAEWTVDTVPPRAKAAVKIMLSELFDRGSEATMPDGVRSLLARLRKPVAA